MPGLRRCESAQNVTSISNMLHSNISNHVPTSLKSTFNPFITKSIGIMDKNKLNVLEFELTHVADNSVLSPEQDASEKDLQIQVLDIDDCGIISDTEEMNDENYLNSVDEIAIGDLKETNFYSHSEAEESSPLANKKVNDKSFGKIQVRNYKCCRCRFSTQNSRKYLYHLQELHQEKFVIHECNVCEYATKHIKNLQRHYDAIHVERTMNGTESPKQFSKFLSHFPKNTEIESSGTFQCDFCSFNTTSKRIFSVHITSHNSTVNDESAETEDINSKTFSTECNGTMTEYESGFDPDIEKILALDYVSFKALKNYTCPLCNMNLRYVSWMIRHLRTNHRGSVQAENLATAYENKKRGHQTATSTRSIRSVHSTPSKQLVVMENLQVAEIRSKKYSTDHIVNRIEESKSDFDTNTGKFALMGNSISKIQKNYKCPFCKMNIRYICWMIRHLRVNHKGNVKAETLANSYEKCKRRKRPNNTGRGIYRNNILKKHTNLHVSPFASNCSQIQSENLDLISSMPILSITDNHKRYENSYTDPVNILRCNICYNKFTELLEFQEHMQAHLALNSDFSSDTFDNINANRKALVIPKTGKQSTVLRNIRNRFGSKCSTFKYKCPYCPFSIASVSRFHIHFIQHMKNLQFKCSDCDYHSTWKWTVVKHIWSKVCDERNHFNASVFSNNELIDLNSFKLYKRYLVNVDQFKSSNSQLDMSQMNAIQRNQGAWSAKSVNLFNNGLNETSVEKYIIPNLPSTNIPNSQRETNYYYCKECNFRSVTKQIVINHLAIHAGTKPYQCSVCNLKSNWKYVVIRHMKATHTGHNKIIEQKVNFIQEGFVLCRESVFENSDKSYEHSKLVPQQVFSCDICPYTSSKQFHLDFHQKMHRYREGADFKCDKCPYFVKFAKSLIKHKKLHSHSTFGIKKYFKTDEGVKNFENSLSMEKSPKKYFRRKTLACSKCPARFSLSNRLKKHEGLHGANHRFKCNLCDYSVDCGATLVKHNKLHEVKRNQKLPGCTKSFSCPICPAVFKIKHRYKRHLKFHNRNYGSQLGVQRNLNTIKSTKLQLVKRKLNLNLTKSLTCPKCPAVFCSPNRHLRHLELHGANLKFACRYCDFSVRNGVNIQRHEKVHNKKTEFSDFSISPEFLACADNTGETISVTETVAVEPVTITNDKKLFICDRCPFSSESKTAVQTHLRSHYLKQGFECPYCDYSAVNKGSLQAHKKLHLEGSKLYPPQAFMKFQSFKIIIQEKNGEKVVFDDEIIVNQGKESENQVDSSRVKDAINNVQTSLTNCSGLEKIGENHTKDTDMRYEPISQLKSNKEPIVILTDIFRSLKQ